MRKATPEEPEKRSDLAERILNSQHPAFRLLDWIFRLDWIENHWDHRWVRIAFSAMVIAVLMAFFYFLEKP